VIFTEEHHTMTETTRRHVRRSRSDWQQLIDEQARSGVSQTAFCAARTVSTTSFQHWKRRLAAAASPSPSPTWLDLGPLRESVAAGWDLELELGAGVCLRLRRC
jgi:putative transposase